MIVHCQIASAYSRENRYRHLTTASIDLNLNSLYFINKNTLITLIYLEHNPVQRYDNKHIYNNQAKHLELSSALFHWNADPALLTLGPITIHWYGLMFALAFIIGLQIMHWIYRREQRSSSELDSLFIYILAGTIIGARLGHVLFYDPAFYFSQPLEILKIWKGGLASHGGTLGIIIAVYIYSRKPDHPTPLWILDRFCMTAALGGAFIRIGNFFNSEIIGLPVNGGIIFDRFDPLPRHPVQLYESLSYLLIFIIMLFIYKKMSDKLKDGRLFGLFLVVLFSTRFFLEFFKIRQAQYAQSMEFSVGQWLSIPLVILGIWLILRKQKTGQ